MSLYAWSRSSQTFVSCISTYRQFHVCNNNITCQLWNFLCFSCSAVAAPKSANIPMEYKLGQFSLEWKRLSCSALDFTYHGIPFRAWIGIIHLIVCKDENCSVICSLLLCSQKRTKIKSWYFSRGALNLRQLGTTILEKLRPHARPCTNTTERLSPL